LLRHLSFSRQKARFVSDHLDAEALQSWMEEEWPRIMSQTRQPGEPLFFGDEASFTSWASLSYTLSQVGEPSRGTDQETQRIQDIWRFSKSFS
jgi:hypothetical protein